jgi:23S rRNA (adenine2503-C2)-methyltransferase
MRLLETTGNPELAMVYVAEDSVGRRFEFVDSVQPPRSRDEKWVVIVSTMFGCPVGCSMCDAGGSYEGHIDAEGILWQVRRAVEERFGNGGPMTAMLKVQFARMGEPTLNPNVLKALDALPREYSTKVVASVSTVAPRGCGAFLGTLKEIKDRSYAGGDFQLQFSIHSTDPEVRAGLCPIRTLSFGEMAREGAAFRTNGDKKVTLNFCLIEGVPLEPTVVAAHFDPQHFLIKLTPMNPTAKAHESGLTSIIGPGTEARADGLIDRFRELGYEVLLSIGEYEENQIGSNCGQFISALENESYKEVNDSYHHFQC